MSAASTNSRVVVHPYPHTYTPATAMFAPSRVLIRSSVRALPRTAAPRRVVPVVRGFASGPPKTNMPVLPILAILAAGSTAFYYLVQARKGIHHRTPISPTSH